MDVFASAIRELMLFSLIINLVSSDDNENCKQYPHYKFKIMWDLGLILVVYNTELQTSLK